MKEEEKSLRGSIWRTPKERLGRMGGRALGPEGECVCPRCGTTLPHEVGVPCNQRYCPKCGTRMVRK